MTAPVGLPPGLVAYRRTPVFDANTIPAGLRREHRTRPGVWAVINVLAGKLRFRTLPPDPELHGGTCLSAGQHVVIAPGQLHEVEPDGPVRFFVEFYRADERTHGGPERVRSTAC